MKLPEIFKNTIDKPIRNSQEVFYSEKKTDLIHQPPYYAIIQIKNQSIKVRVIGRTNNYLVTDSGKIIYLKDCTNIKLI